MVIPKIKILVREKEKKANSSDRGGCEGFFFPKIKRLTRQSLEFEKEIHWSKIHNIEQLILLISESGKEWKKIPVKINCGREGENILEQEINLTRLKFKTENVQDQRVLDEFLDKTD